MAVIGFHFKKMSVEKKKPATGKINVNNNITMLEVKEANVNMGTAKQKGVEFSFHFKTRYQPEIANIDLEGSIVYLGKDAKVKESLDQWKKEKKLPNDVLEEVYNTVLAKCNIQALILGRDMGLPAHIPMPKVTGK